jgi:DNA (cytosine-5)-methyltransferase 1
VFVVGYLGDWRRAAAVLFERHSLSGNPAPSRETGKVAPTIPSRSLGGGGLGTDFDCDGGLIAFNSRQECVSSDEHFGTLNTCHPQDQAIAYAIQERAVSVNLEAVPQGKGYQAEAAYTLEARNKVQSVAIPIDMRQASRGATMTNNRAEGTSGGAPGTGIGEPGDPAPTVSTSHVAAVAFAQNQRDELRTMNVAGALAAEPGMKQQTYVATSAVRRLTPKECLRLQGFPDDYFDGVMLRGKPLADGPRYKMLGNSMAVPVLRWIGERIQMVENIAHREASRDAA